MHTYIIDANRNENAEHLVHNITKGCEHLPEKEYQYDFGAFSSSEEAIKYAKEKYYFVKVNDCKNCGNKR